MILKELITAEDLHRLVEEKIPENKYLEYKAIPKIGNGTGETRKIGKYKEKKEFLADISAFANTKGGDMIIGIKDNKEGEPEGFEFINKNEQDSLISQMESICMTGLNPRIPNLSFTTIDMGDNKICIRIHIPKSPIAPHRIVLDNSKRFYARCEKGKYEPDVQELRDIFLARTSLNEKIQNFRQDRFYKIITNEDLLPLVVGTKVIFHVIPLYALNNTQVVDLESVRDNPKLLQTYGLGSNYNRNTFDGYLCATPPVISGGNGFDYGGYSQIFTNGVIESVCVVGTQSDNAYGGLTDKEKYSFHAFAFMTHTLKLLVAHFELLNRLGVQKELALSLSITDLKGTYLGFDSHHLSDYPLEKSMLHFPILKMDNREGINRVDVAEELREWFDLLWRAYGKNQCNYYDEKGFMDRLLRGV